LVFETKNALGDNFFTPGPGGQVKNWHLESGQLSAPKSFSIELTF
jgi:hypothetical protein